MKQPKIGGLTPEQLELITLHQHEWKNFVLSTERIERRKATEAMQSAYSLIGEEKPEFVFVTVLIWLLGLLILANLIWEGG